MICIERLRPEHLPALRLQTVQSAAQAVLTEDFGRDLVAQKGVAWTAIQDGQVIAAAGIAEMWQDRGLGWALFSEAALANFTLIHRMTRKVLAEAPWRRVEVAVDVNHAEGMRWAERLGFSYEGTMKAYTIDGRDCHLYARVR